MYILVVKVLLLKELQCLSIICFVGTYLGLLRHLKSYNTCLLRIMLLFYQYIIIILIIREGPRKGTLVTGGKIQRVLPGGLFLWE